MKKGKMIKFLDILRILVAAVYLFGIFFVFKPCSASEDASTMLCRNAGLAIGGCTGVIFVLSILHLFCGFILKKFVSVLIAAAAVIAIVIPNQFLELCADETMRCHTTMYPAVVLFSGLILLISVLDIVSGRKIKRIKAR